MAIISSGPTMAQANLCDGGAASVWAACRGQRQRTVGQGGGGRYSIWRDCQASVRFNLAGNGRVETCTKKFIKFVGEDFLSSIYFSQDQLAFREAEKICAKLVEAPPPSPLPMPLQLKCSGLLCFTVTPKWIH